jgi:predicted metal-dependent hydrolase
MLIHELAHAKEHNHLSTAYHDELCRIGSHVAEFAINNQHLFPTF